MEDVVSLDAASHFLTWAIDDVRDLDQLVWQHIAPALYPELQQEYDNVFTQERPQGEGDTFRDSLDTLLSLFVNKLYESGRYDSETIDISISRKLEDLDVYRGECKDNLEIKRCFPLPHLSRLTGDEEAYFSELMGLS